MKKAIAITNLVAMQLAAVSFALAQQPVPVDFISRVIFVRNISSVLSGINGLDAVPKSMVLNWFNSELAGKSEEMRWTGEGYLFRIPLGPEPATGRRAVYGPPSFVDHGATEVDALLRDQLTNKLRPPIPGNERLYVWVTRVDDQLKIGYVPVEFAAPMEQYVIIKASHITLQQLDTDRAGRVYTHIIDRLEVQSAALAKETKVRELYENLQKTAQRIDSMENDLATELRRAQAQQELLGQMQLMRGAMTLTTAIAGGQNVVGQNHKEDIAKSKSVDEVIEKVRLSAGDQQMVITGMRGHLVSEHSKLDTSQG